MEALLSRLISAKAFIFDFYGTIVEIDYEPPQMWETLNQMGYNSCLALQETWEADAFDGCFTPNFDFNSSYQEWRNNNIRQFIRQSGAPFDKIEDILQLLLVIERQATKRAVPSAYSIVELLRKNGKKIGLCSNWDFPIEPYLEEAQLPEFDAVSVSSVVGSRKPNANIFHDICNKLNVPPQDAVFIGDNWLNDVRGALRVDMLPVWIRHDNPPSSLQNLVIEAKTLSHFEEQLLALFDNV